MTQDSLTFSGEMGAKVAAHDWSATPLGPIESWPPALRIAVQTTLGSHCPQCLVWGPDYTSIFNDAFLPILGAKPEALGGSFRECWAEAWPTLAPLVKDAYEGKATFIEDFPLSINRYGHAEEAWFTFCYSPVYDEHGQVAGMLDTVIETTGKFTADQKLRALASSLEQQVAARTADRNRLWQLSSDLMMVAHFDGTVMALNPAWREMLGWDEDELLGRNLVTFVHPDDIERCVRATRSLSKGERLLRFDSRHRHRNGNYRWISWSAVPADGVMIAVGRDITAEREQAETLQRTEEMLRHSQKMEAVGQLTGGLAHDFNNLLIAITGSLELLTMRLDQGRLGEAGRYIGAAQGAAQRAAALTHRLLAFSRRQTLDPKPTNICRLLAGLDDLLRRTMGPAVEIQASGPVDLWTAQVDQNQLESALLNLCINARDAMPAGGRLTIETANRELDEAAAQQLELAPGQYLTLSVTDTGSGMSRETVRHAFEPFFTTKPTGQGTGLGLSMVYGFARQSGGNAQIQSEPGKGTTVTLFLPRYQGEEELAPVVTTDEEGRLAEHGETVLVIDDEPTLRMLIGEVLDDLGYHALEAEDGAAGLNILQSEQHIDLLITDVGLPGGMNGRQVADAARLLRPGLNVLFITGYAESAVIGDGHLEPGMQVLTKPFPLDDLASRIRTMLQE